ncbi:MAG: pyridoxal-dependent decarboxylase [Phycisphaerales bacterium]
MPAPSSLPPGLSPDEFRRRGHELIESIAAYWESLIADADPARASQPQSGGPTLPVLCALKPGEILSRLPASAPLHPEPWEQVRRDLDSIVIPGLTHWQSPNFFAYFPTNGSVPGVLGDMFATGLGINGLTWAASPVATELEIRMLDWMAELIGLPDSFRSTSPAGGGSIQGTASEATLVALLAARGRAAGADAPFDPRLTVYTSTQAHSSVLKAAMIAGFARTPDDRRRLRMIDCDDLFQMKPDALDRAMRHDADAGLVPAFVCATVGTTSSGSVDPVPRIAEVCERHRAWLHVDAAWAGAACVCPEYQHLLQGVDHADSICFNPHKWLLTNFDCDLFWTRDRPSVLAALSVTPEYLRHAATDAGAITDFRDWQIPLGRRFRALKLWFVVREFGVEGLRRHVRRGIALGELFESLVAQDARFQIAAPRSLSLVCFRLCPRPAEPPDAADARNRRLLAAINDSGRLHLIHTTLPIGGRPTVVLRMALGGNYTGPDHVRAAWEFIRAATDRVS